MNGIGNTTHRHCGLNPQSPLAPICNRCDNTKARFAKPRQRKKVPSPLERAEGEVFQKAPLSPLKGKYYRRDVACRVLTTCNDGYRANRKY